MSGETIMVHQSSEMNAKIEAGLIPKFIAWCRLRPQYQDLLLQEERPTGEGPVAVRLLVYYCVIPSVPDLYNHLSHACAFICNSRLPV